jgi:23S rRNA (guanosine2251-2'-O)-methyltransferase
MSEKPTAHGADFISGRNPVLEMLQTDPSRLTKVFIVDGMTASFRRQITALAKEHGVPVQTVPGVRLERTVPGVNHQGIVAQVSSVGYSDVHEILTRCGPMREDVIRDKPIVLLLDQIQDPYNFGAIIRSAAAAGAGGVIVPERNAAPLSSGAIKASAGAAMNIPVGRTPNLLGVLDELKERGYWIVGADGTADTSIWDMDWDRPLGIVIGNEDKGLRSPIAKACDFKVKIPMPGPVESLNASVAAGLILFVAAHARDAKRAE